MLFFCFLFSLFFGLSKGHWLQPSVEEGAGSVPRCEFYGVFFHCLRYVKLMSLLSDVGSGVQRLAESSGMRRRFTNVLPKRGRNDESKASMNWFPLSMSGRSEPIDSNGTKSGKKETDVLLWKNVDCVFLSRNEREWRWTISTDRGKQMKHGNAGKKKREQPNGNAIFRIFAGK